MGESPSEYKLKSTPQDGITAVKFSPVTTANHLLVTSWDCSLRLYDITANNQRMKVSSPQPLLDCCFLDNVHAYYGGLGGKLQAVDFNTHAESVIGGHEDTIRCLDYCPDVNVIISGSWDSTVKLWDPRSLTCVGTLNQPDKVYTMSVCGDRIIVGTAGRKILVWDLRNIGYVQQRRESSLKYQTRCIRSFPNKQGYVLSSIEGRVAVEYLDPSPEIQKRKYAFKCHRIKDEGVEKIYPVTSIAFHQEYSTFASGGSDGFVNIWDGFNKKRLCQFHKYPTSIASLDFSKDGTHLAIASSYMHKMGQLDSPPTESVFIRHVTDQYPTSIASLDFSKDGTHLAIASSYMHEMGQLDSPPTESVFIRHVTDQETKPK